MKKLFSTCGALFYLMVIVFSVPGFAGDYQPEVLDKVIKSVEVALNKNETPVVVFDLDDTLINTKYRSRRILREFSQSEKIEQLFPEAAEKLSDIPLTQVQYELEDTFHGLNLTNEKLFSLAQDFWLPRFFSNPYVAKDEEIRGGARYVNALSEAGAFIVYLTGRDMPRMEQGTRESLRRLGFPSNEFTWLLMKPNKEVDDLSFKKGAFRKINEIGKVIAGFENEPANINAFQAEWPEGTMVFLDTMHSKKPDVPQDEVYWIPDYLK